MKRTLLIALMTLANIAFAQVSIPLTAEAWNQGANMQFGQYLRQDSVLLGGGVYAAKGTDMYNGQIDVDIAMHGQRGFIGIVFRHQSDTDYELIYLRPHKSRLPDALQYTPVLNGLSAWQLYSGDGYTAPAELAHNRWVHLKVVIEHDTVSVFIDDHEEPALVSKMKGDLASGAVGLWGLNVAHFANFTYTPSDTSATKKRSQKTNIPENAITDWQLSQVFEFEAQTDRLVPETATWQSVDVEDGALLNISRYRANIDDANRTIPTSNKDLVFARTIIESKTNSLRTLNFGYSDDVTILLNGKPLYTGRSGFSQRYPNSLGIVGLENDAVYLDLKTGKNELVFAVAEVFGGWGLVATLED